MVPGCKMVTNKSCNMRQHFRMHDGRRPYECYICKASFTQVCNLKLHLIKKHKGCEINLTPRRISECPMNLLQANLPLPAVNPFKIEKGARHLPIKRNTLL